MARLMSYHYSHFPSVRLATAGFASLVLLAWLTFVPGTLPPMLSLGVQHLMPILASAGLSLIILVILVPVFWRGPRRDRWLAALVSVFPMLVFGVTALWLVSYIF